MKFLGSAILLSLVIATAAFSVSVGWRLGKKAVPQDMPDSVILNVTPPVVSVPQ